MRYIWRAVRDIPHLHVAAGDYLVYEPGGPEPYRAVRPVTVDPGAVLFAEQAGDLTCLPSDETPAVRLRLIPGGQTGRPGRRRVSGQPPDPAA